MEKDGNQFKAPELLMKLLDKIAKDEGLVNHSSKITSGSEHGDGFVGILYRITIEGIKNGKNYSMNLVAKMPPLNPTRREQFYSIPLFEREVLLYNVILPDFIKFQRERNIKEEDGFYNIPRCYAAVHDIENDFFVIIMEDLRTADYIMRDKLTPATYDHVKLLVKELGRLHAISFAMKAQEPERFEKCQKLRDLLLQSFRKGGDGVTKYFDVVMDNAINTLEPHEEFKKNKVEKLKKDYIKTFEECDDVGNIGEFGVLTHGDCWNNNMMYRYDETNTPEKVCMIDYQLARFGSPALDVLYFLFTSTDKGLRTEHYDNLIRIYYKHLSAHLTRLGSNPDKIFTLNNLLMELRKFGKFGLCMTAMVIPMISAESKDIPDLDKMAETLNDGTEFDGFDKNQENVIYKTRMADVIRDIIRLGYY